MEPIEEDDALTGKPAKPLGNRPFQILGVLLSMTTLLVFFIGYRLSQRGQWLPDAPEMIGPWVISEKPLAQAALQQLGNPRTRGRIYENPFEEKVDVHLISASDYQSYFDPQYAMGNYDFAVTGEKRFPLFGPEAPVRAIIFRNNRSQQRYLMYYWIQNRDGSTNVRDSLRLGGDFFPRMRLGLNATFSGKENCIIRAFTQVAPTDISGLQARRNMNEVCRGMHDYWMKAGSK